MAGTDMCLARPVAVKLLRPELAADAGTLAGFRDSARRTGSVVHEGIARIYDYVESGSSHPPFVVMEFVDGPSLAEVAAGGPVGPGRVMDVVGQAAVPCMLRIRRAWCTATSSHGTPARSLPWACLLVPADQPSSERARREFLEEALAPLR